MSLVQWFKGLKEVVRIVKFYWDTRKEGPPYYSRPDLFLLSKYPFISKMLYLLGIVPFNITRWAKVEKIVCDSYIPTREIPSLIQESYNRVKDMAEGKIKVALARTVDECFANRQLVIKRIKANED